MPTFDADLYLRGSASIPVPKSTRHDLASRELRWGIAPHQEGNKVYEMFGDALIAEQANLAAMRWADLGVPFVYITAVTNLIKSNKFAAQFYYELGLDQGLLLRGKPFSERLPTKLRADQFEARLGACWISWMEATGKDKADARADIDRFFARLFSDRVSTNLSDFLNEGIRVGRAQVQAYERAKAPAEAAGDGEGFQARRQAEAEAYLEKVSRPTANDGRYTQFIIRHVNYPGNGTLLGAGPPGTGSSSSSSVSAAPVSSSGTNRASSSTSSSTGADPVPASISSTASNAPVPAMTSSDAQSAPAARESTLTANSLTAHALSAVASVETPSVEVPARPTTSRRKREVSPTLSAGSASHDSKRNKPK